MHLIHLENLEYCVTFIVLDHEKTQRLQEIYKKAYFRVSRTRLMSFFLSKSAMGLKSMLNVSSNNTAEEGQIHLDDAAAIQRILFTSEGVRPVIEGVVAFTVKSATLLQLDSILYKA